MPFDGVGAPPVAVGSNPYQFETPGFAVNTTTFLVSQGVILLTSAANIAGAWIISFVDRTLYTNATIGLTALFVGPNPNVSPPVITDEVLISAPTQVFADGTGAGNAVHMYTYVHTPTFVPAGHGVWFANFGTNSTSGLRFLRYQLL